MFLVYLLKENFTFHSYFPLTLGPFQYFRLSLFPNNSLAFGDEMINNTQRDASLCRIVWLNLKSQVKCLFLYYSFIFQLCPTSSRSLLNAMKFIQNPRRMCDRVFEMVKEITARIKMLKMELKSRGK